MSSGTVAIVGATGVVGREALTILAERGVPAEKVRALASERSAGSSVAYNGTSLPVTPATPESFAGVGLAIFCASADAARSLVPHAIAAGAVVVDNSSAFRLDESVPLVVPEINGGLVGAPGGARAGLIANPNCSTIILLGALEPLRRAFGVRAIDVATYQAVSGAGQAGMDDLVAQARAFGRDSAAAPAFFREPCLFNVFSHDSAVDPDTGLNGEERKIIDESRKIWGDPTLRVTPTCVRVPVLRAHTQAITVELERPARESEVRAALGDAAWLRVVDDRAANDFPTPLKASGRDEILVGRLRPDPSERETSGAGPAMVFRRWSLLASGDQLRKGAALNAIQIGGLAGVLPAALEEQVGVVARS
jgi:aspartate-semialdehyde dehydrogenase